MMNLLCSVNAGGLVGQTAPPVLTIPLRFHAFLIVWLHAFVRAYARALSIACVIGTVAATTFQLVLRVDFA